MKLHRVDGILEINQLAQHTIILAGLGSLGSMTAANLAYPWKEIVLVDPEDLGPENVERHVLGYDSLNKPKVDEMRKWLVNRGLDDSIITAHKGYIQDIFSSYKHASVVICNIDNTPRLDVNRWCIENNIPAVYGGIYPLGIGGEIDVIPNPREACYVCAQQLVGGNEYKGKEGVDYGLDPSLFVDDRGDAHAVPALRHIISKTAGDMAAATMDLLLENTQIDASIMVEADSWLEVLYASSSKIKPFSEYISATKSSGLIPNAKIGMKEGKFVLEMRKGTFTLNVNRWNECPYHNDGNVVLAEDI